MNRTSPSVVAVQLNHFACGGAAMAVSISHKIADGFTMASFIKDWACVTGGGSPVKPDFFSSAISNIIIPEFTPMEACEVKYVTKSLEFPNSKLNELKNKINAMDTIPLNPTRVESLTSLLFKCAAGAARTEIGSFSQLNLQQMVNLRGKTNANFPKFAAGNLFAAVSAKMMDYGRIELNEVITGLRKGIMDLQEVKDAEEVAERKADDLHSLMNDQIPTYFFSSVCRLPFYQVDFGWGKPVRVILRSEIADANLFLLMDTPCGDGIEARVHLKEEEMDIFQKDKELLAYVEDI